MTALEIWMRYSVQPAAIANFGMPIVEIRQISAYSCRTMNNKKGAELSEHAFGNALDIAGFKLANGRVIVVKSGWRGSADEQRFLREVFSSACKTFKTVLGPGAAYHSDHFHVDLARHGKSGTGDLLQAIAADDAAGAAALRRRQIRRDPGPAALWHGRPPIPARSRRRTRLLVTDQLPSYEGSPFFPKEEAAPLSIDDLATGSIDQ